MVQACADEAVRQYREFDLAPLPFDALNKGISIAMATIPPAGALARLGDRENLHSSVRDAVYKQFQSENARSGRPKPFLGRHLFVRGSTSSSN